MGYQPEERYWTDYLRLALPIVGLLLMIGLFWFWAQRLIGDDTGNSPRATATTAVEIVVTQAPPTPTEAVETEITPDTTTRTDATSTTGDETPVEGDTPEPEGIFSEGDAVIVNDNDVNMRGAAGIDAEIVEKLSEGTELIVTGTYQEADDYVWWPVRDPGTDVEGWVVEDFLEKQ